MSRISFLARVLESAPECLAQVGTLICSSPKTYSWGRYGKLGKASKRLEEANREQLAQCNECHENLENLRKRPQRKTVKEKINCNLTNFTLLRATASTKFFCLKLIELKKVVIGGHPRILKRTLFICF